MSCATAVAHRAARHVRVAIPAIVALMVALTATLSAPEPAEAAAYSPRVVIVVGPSHGATTRYIERANLIASQAKAYGATVTKLYTPNATWSRVVSASQGANLFVYLGHGNGWPSPYAPYQGLTKNGLGLNPRTGAGRTSPVKYYGEAEIAQHIRFAPGAVVILNHLCYASGNGEPGFPEPSWTTARKRVDNYAAGFLRARASAVLADGHSNLGYELAALFGRKRSLLSMWRNDPHHNDSERSFSSVRTPGFRVHIDPDERNSGFYRSLVTKGYVVTTGIRVRPWRGHATTNVVLRTAPSIGADRRSVLADGASFYVTGPSTVDGAGRTWAPVITLKGRSGWVAAWNTAVSGSAAPRMNVWMRTRPKTTASKVVVVKANTRVRIVKSTVDSRERLWLYVRTPSGKTGWIAGWLARP